MPRATTTSRAVRTTATAAQTAPELAPLTVADIAEQTDPQSFSRGRGYVRGGRIFNPIRRDNMLQAQCHGSSGGPYHVMATLAPADQQKGENLLTIGCDCPRGGFCKHIVALLLTWIETPAKFEVRPPIGELLAAKSREELVALIELVLAEDFNLEDRVLSLITLPLPGAGTPSRELIDEAALRRQIVKEIQGGSYDYEYGFGYGNRYRDYDEYYTGRRIAGNLRQIRSLGNAYVQASDWRNAHRVYATLIEELEPGFDALIGYDHEGDLIAAVAECDRGLAAALDAQRDLPESERLTADERQRLLDAICLIWELDLGTGGHDMSDEGPEAIARGATLDEQRAVGTRVRQMIAPATDNNFSQRYRNQAAIGFLSRLSGEAGLSDERLLTEYRNAELWEEAADTLLRLNRVEEAIALAARRLTVASSLTHFADHLIATGDPTRIDQAITLVDGCLWEREGQQPRHDHALSAWLEAQYAKHGRPERALQMARNRFQSSPSKETYTAVKTAALLPDQPGNPWPELRPEVLATLKKRGDWFGLIDIHLTEGEVAEALVALRRTERGVHAAANLAYGWAYVDGGHKARVAAAAEQDFPDEAIRLYRQLADRQIEGRQRMHYHEAAKYLARVKQVLAATGRTDDWLTLITELRQGHKTLRALQDELNKAGLE